MPSRLPEVERMGCIPVDIADDDGIVAVSWLYYEPTSRSTLVPRAVPFLMARPLAAN